jgi:23S rRNA G2445 N2-methylase RlmL
MYKTRETSHSYYAHTMPGLEKVAWSEIEARLRGAKLEGFKVIPGKNGMVLFRYPGDVEDVLQLRTIEDVYYVLARIPHLPWGFEGLSRIYEGVSTGRTFHEGLAMYRRVMDMRSGTRTNFRIIARMVGKEQPFRRSDLARSIGKAVERATRRSWRSVEQGEDIELWANLVGLDLVLGLRLSDADMRHRDYKVTHLPASLRPSVAAAMAWLTQPDASDTFMDPMCGAGTLLIERAIMARHSLLLGGDLEQPALQAAMENMGPKHKPRQLFRWDARRLPVASGTIDRIATNPPFGVKLGNPRENPRLYRGLLTEIDRVLKLDGRAVVLSGEIELVKEILRDIPRLHIKQSYPVVVLGQRAMIFVLNRPR